MGRTYQQIREERLRSPMHRDYGVSLVGLLRGIARKIDEFYAQGLWGKFSGAIERYCQKD